jgi:hypothetical protein
MIARHALAVMICLLGLGGCGLFGSSLEPANRRDAELVVSDVPGQEQTVFVRSTRPRLLGQIFRRVPGDPGPARRAELAAAAAEHVEAVPAGTVLVPDCEIAEAELGPQVDTTPAGFALHDPSPGSAEPRDMFVTGFADGCPRRLVAASATLGSASAHEAVRYNPLNEAPWSATDIAYQHARLPFCGTAMQACPPAALDELDRRFAFLSHYDRFGPEARWQVILLRAPHQTPQQPRETGDRLAMR